MTRPVGTSTRTCGAEMIRSLLEGAKTVSELADFAPGSRDAVRSWVQILRKSGVIYIKERRPRPKNRGGLASGPCEPVFALQAVPFGEPDAPLSQRTERRRELRK